MYPLETRRVAAVLGSGAEPMACFAPASTDFCVGVLQPDMQSTMPAAINVEASCFDLFMPAATDPADGRREHSRILGDPKVLGPP